MVSSARPVLSRFFWVPMVLAVVAAGTFAGPASAAPTKVVKLSAPAKVTKGSTYKARGAVKNTSKKTKKGKVKLTLSRKKGKPGGTRLGSTTVKVKRKPKKNFTIPFKVSSSVKTGRYFLVACFKGSCRSRSVTVLDEVVPPGPDFRPGATTAGDTLFPGIGNGGYDALNYDITLDYDPLTNVFNPGTHTTMTAQATQDLSSFSLDFMPATMAVSSVTVDGNTVPYTFEDIVLADGFTFPDAKMVLDLGDNGIEEGTQFDVDVAYSGYVTHVTDPDTSREGWVRACRTGAPSPTNLTCFGSFTVSEPIGAMSWFPSNNVPADKATFDTTTTVPDELLDLDDWTALGTGEFVSKVDNGDSVTWKWQEVQPTSTYLTTGSVGRYSYTVGSVTDASNSETFPVYNAYDLSATPTQVTNMETAFAAQSGIINLFSPLFGAYPFSSGGLLGARTTGVGYYLENQGKIHAPSPQIPLDILAHEYVHQWFGDAVGPSEWSQIWFNEGWAQWGEWYYTSPTEPATRFDDIYANATADDWSIPPGTLDGDAANLFAEFPTYTRAGMMIEGYRQIVGDTKFFAFAKALQTNFAYSTVDAADFTDLALSNSGFTGGQLTLLTDYFDEWLFLPGKPTIVPADFGP